MERKGRKTKQTYNQYSARLIITDMWTHRSMERAIANTHTQTSKVRYSALCSCVLHPAKQSSLSARRECENVCSYRTSTHSIAHVKAPTSSQVGPPIKLNPSQRSSPSVSDRPRSTRRTRDVRVFRCDSHTHTHTAQSWRSNGEPTRMPRTHNLWSRPVGQLDVSVCACV